MRVRVREREREVEDTAFLSRPTPRSGGHTLRALLLALVANLVYLPPWRILLCSPFLTMTLGGSTPIHLRGLASLGKSRFLPGAPVSFWKLMHLLIRVQLCQRSLGLASWSTVSGIFWYLQNQWGILKRVLL